MNEQKKKPIIGIGTTSIVLIFVMLCMLTFSVLSLATAQADLRLSRKSAERTTAYYDAENRANDILLSVIDCVNTYLPASSEASAAPAGETSADAFYTAVRGDLEGTDGISFTDDSHLKYDVALADEQILCVSIELSYEGFSDGQHYRILSWNTESTHEWNNETPLPVL